MTGNAGRDDETGNAIIDTARVLLREGLVARTWGNLSQRSGHDRYLITPSGRDYETMTPDHLVEVDFEGKWSGELKPSGERGLHTEIYRELPQVQFIIHTHQPYASALSVGGAPVEIPTELAERIGSETLPIADYGLPSTGKLHKSVLTTLRDTAARAILMQGHGAVLFGRDADELVDLAQAVESACQIQFELMTGWSRAGETVRHSFAFLVFYPHHYSTVSKWEITQSLKISGLSTFCGEFGETAGKKLVGSSQRTPPA